jgi:tetratricopeptide (TPR) repeat protein
MILKKNKMVLPKTTLYKLFLPLFLLSFSAGTFAESTYNKGIYDAFVTGDMTKWDHVIRTMEASNSTITVDQKLELINYYYGYIGYLIGKKQYEPAEKLISKGEKLIAQVLHNSPKNATAYSFKGSFLGFQIGICKYKAVFLGSDSKSFINKSLEIDPQNVQGLIDKGNLLYYSPKLFGGDKKEALIFFLKAVKVMEQKKETNENWVYLNLLSIIASSYEKTDNLVEARITYEKIIRNEPDIKWIKDNLYPQLLAKMKS